MSGDCCYRFWKGLVLALLVLAGAFLFTSCETTHDPKDGPTEDVSNIPWNRQEAWEGNPYGTHFPGSR